MPAPPSVLSPDGLVEHDVGADAPDAIAVSPDGPATRRLADWRWTILAGVAVTAARFLFAADRRMFHVIPDESAQLAMARWFGGGTRWNLFDHIPFRPGYALAVGPLWQLTGTGESFIRATLALNAVMAGASAIVLVRLLRRWTDLAAGTCAWLATMTALAPAVISTSAYTWAESLVTLTFLLTVSAVQRVVDHGRTVDALVAVGVAAWAMTVHGRGLVLVPAATAVGTVALLGRRRWVGAAATVATAVVASTASLEFTRWVQSRVWDAAADNNDAGAVIERLDDPVSLVYSFFGQTWYQLVASLGLVGIGVGVVLASLVRPAGRLDRVSAIVVTVLTAPLIVTSITFMAGRDRPDQLVYGRYVDAVAWPLVALGGAWVVARFDRPPTARPALLPLGVAALTVVTGLVVAFRSGDVLAGDVGLRMMVPGLLPYIGTADGVPVMEITVLAATGVVVLAVVAGRARSSTRTAIIGAGVVAVALLWAGCRVHDAQALRLNSWAIGDDVAEIDAIVPPGEPIGAVFARDATEELGDQRMRYQLYQLFLPDHEFVWEHHRLDLAHRFVVGPSDWQPFHDAGYVIRWRDPDRPMALWEHLDGRIPR